MCTNPYNIYIYYLTFINVCIYIYILYTYTHNTHLLVHPYPWFPASIIIFCYSRVIWIHLSKMFAILERKAMPRPCSSERTGLPRARVPSQRPWKWVEEMRSSHLGKGPKSWWTSHLNDLRWRSWLSQGVLHCWVSRKSTGTVASKGELSRRHGSNSHPKKQVL